MIDISSTLTSMGPAAVLLLMAIVFAESGLLAGFFLPGDSLLFSAGVLVATGAISVPFAVVAAAVVLAAIAGDQVGYLTGRRLGPRMFRRPDSRFFSRQNADRAQTFFATHGSKAVILARFVPVVRTFTPTVAGVGAMPYRRFTLFNAIGALLWGVGMLTAGRELGGITFVSSHIEVITLAVVAASLVPAAIGVLHSRRTPDFDETDATDESGAGAEKTLSTTPAP